MKGKCKQGQTFTEASFIPLTKTANYFLITYMQNKASL